MLIVYLSTVGVILVLIALTPLYEKYKLKKVRKERLEYKKLKATLEQEYESLNKEWHIKGSIADLEITISGEIYDLLSYINQTMNEPYDPLNKAEEYDSLKEKVIDYVKKYKRFEPLLKVNPGIELLEYIIQRVKINESYERTNSEFPSRGLFKKYKPDIKLDNRFKSDLVEILEGLGLKYKYIGKK